MHNLKARNKRPATDGESTPKAKRGRPKQSLVLTRYPPMKHVGDDEVSVSRNTQLLHKELEKDKPRKEIVLSLARQTYFSRRAQVLSEAEEVSASGLLLQYKELKKPYVVGLSV